MRRDREVSVPTVLLSTHRPFALNRSLEPTAVARLVLCVIQSPRGAGLVPSWHWVSGAESSGVTRHAFLPLVAQGRIQGDLLYGGL